MLSRQPQSDKKIQTPRNIHIHLPSIFLLMGQKL